MTMCTITTQNNPWLASRISKTSTTSQSERRPLLIQAPMEDVTDTAFRQMLNYVGSLNSDSEAKNYAPDIYFTEFTNVDGVFSEGEKRVSHRLKFDSKAERPIIAQIWGQNPENYYNGAKYVKKLGFDGVDINMGCPQRKIVGKGLCAALIEDHDQAEKIISATIDAASTGTGNLPVSIKTRIGIKEIVTEEWISFLLNFDLAAITVHGRTVKEKSKVPCHWDEIGKAVQVRSEYSRSKWSRSSRKSPTLIIGNGDIKNYSEALQRAREYGVDGVMIGRGMLEDIQAFIPEKHKKPLTEPQSLELLLKHLIFFEESWRDLSNVERYKSANVFKKYVKTYVSGYKGAKELRHKLMECISIQEMKSLIERSASESKSRLSE